MDNTDKQEQINLSPTEVSKRLKVSVKTLAAWRARGTGPRFFYANPDEHTSPRYPLSEIVSIEQKLLTHN